LIKINHRRIATALLVDLRDNPGGSNSFSDHMLAWIIDQPFRFASDFSVRVSPQAQQAIQARLANSADPSSTDAQLLQRFDQLQTGDRFSFDLPFQAPRDGARFTAPVYVLIDRYSYYNAVSVAAILQDYDAAIVLGEATTDLATTYAAMEHFTLDQTGLRVGFPKALIVRPNGNRLPAGVTPDHLLDSNADMLEEAVNLITSQIGH
jgi:C-terminal processing protease CtpA/Prc